MYEVLVKGKFSGAHNLRGYRGKCEGLHGHNWVIEARFCKSSLNKIGLSIDFKTLKARLKKVLDGFDHKYLNNIKAFKRKNPSAENIAEYIYKSLQNNTKEKDLYVKSVAVWESDTSCAIYYENLV